MIEKIKSQAFKINLTAYLVLLIGVLAILTKNMYWGNYAFIIGSLILMINGFINKKNSIDVLGLLVHLAIGCLLFYLSIQNHALEKKYNSQNVMAIKGCENQCRDSSEIWMQHRRQTLMGTGLGAYTASMSLAPFLKSHWLISSIASIGGISYYYYNYYKTEEEKIRLHNKCIEIRCPKREQ